MDNNHLHSLETNIHYSFKDKELLDLALTHPSYSAEMQMKRIYSNQRLEFLGDAVLELAVSKYLYKKYPDIEEGELTKRRSLLVYEKALYLCAKHIDLGTFVKLGVGEDKNGGRDKPSVLSDTFEALVGALFLDGGINKAFSFINEFVIKQGEKESLPFDGKSLIQSFVQSHEGLKLRYDITDRGMDAANERFKADLVINDKIISSGVGIAKKKAEQEAARKACKVLNIRID